MLSPLRHPCTPRRPARLLRLFLYNQLKCEFLVKASISFWYVLESQNTYACADGVFEQERKMQYLWTWHRSVVPDESSRDFGPCDRFRTRAVGRSLLSDTCYLSSSCHVAHKASTQSHQLSLSAAAFCTSLQFFHPAFSFSLSAVLLHVVLGLPRFRCPCGAQVNAILQSLFGCFLMMWPMNFHLLLRTSSLSFYISAIFRTSLFVIGLLQQTITWYKILHAGGQAHYYSPTGTLKQRDLNQSNLTCLCFNVPVGE